MSDSFVMCSEKFDVDGNQVFVGDLVVTLEPDERRIAVCDLSSEIHPLKFYRVHQVSSAIPARIYLAYLDSIGVEMSGAWDVNLVRKVLNVEACRFLPDENPV